MGYQRIGDYVIEREVENGYEATHVLLPRRVRLTVMHPTFVGLRPVAVRMMREACILEALRHPGVPRVYEVGVLTDQRMQRPWVASELVEGESLLDQSQNGVARLPVRDVVCVLREVAEILGHAHARGVAHRGVRPEAIIRGDGTRGFPLCLINWSEARIAGTSPDADDEQVSSKDSDRACADDVFALGLVADMVLPSRKAAPAKLVALIDDMLAPNPMSRPCAAEVSTRAKLILEALDAPTDDEIIEEENVVLVDISRPTPRPTRPASTSTPPPIPVAKLRWTPPMGVRQSKPTPTGGVAIAVLKPRTP